MRRPRLLILAEHIMNSSNGEEDGAGGRSSLCDPLALKALASAYFRSIGQPFQKQFNRTVKLSKKSLAGGFNNIWMANVFERMAGQCFQIIIEGQCFYYERIRAPEAAPPQIWDGLQLHPIGEFIICFAS